MSDTTWTRMDDTYGALCVSLAELYGDLATVEMGSQIADHLADIGALKVERGRYWLLVMDDTAFYAACATAVN